MHTKTLSDFVYGIRFENLSTEVVNATKMCVLDLIGVAIAGSNGEQGQLWNSYFEQGSQLPEASIWDKDMQKISFANAAALNAAHGHLMDLDDLHNTSIAHLGVVTIPAAIAVGQMEKSSGADVIAAIVGGYEAGARIGEAINPASYHFWHTTAVVGPFSACSAAGKLLRLTPEQFLHAYGSAGTQSAGLWEFLEDGTMSKALHTANATLCGMRAAELAKLGITGASKILEGERGLVRALAPQYDMDALTRGLGSVGYKILSNSLKPYACCRHIHSANYCVEKILKLHELPPERIVHITDRTYQVAKNTADHLHPATAYAYKFSIQYCVAAAILYHSVSNAVFSEERINNPVVRELMNKVEVVVDPKIDEAYKKDMNQWGHRLEIILDDGTKLTEAVTYPIGDFNNPFDWKMAESKFVSLTTGILPEAKAAVITRRITALEELDDINELFAGL